ncbi:MAG TPA: preprotein translocase subunit SecE [Capsulimonadaceae bacterium]|nr:preprotein translocase subunit SecE [Capsulimonadaceae bacterium]
MPDDKQPKLKKEDPRVAAARKRAADLAKAAGGPGVRNRQSGGQFFKDVWTELKKTTWPDRDTLTKSTYVVLAFIAATGVWVFVINFVLNKITAPLFR